MFNKFKKKIPKDLGIKVVSKEKEFWIRAKENCLRAIEEHANVLKLETAMLETIENKLKDL